MISRDTIQQIESRQKNKLQALQLMESICELSRDLCPQVEPLSFSVLSSLVAGERVRVIANDFRLTPEEVNEHAQAALAAIEELKTVLTDKAEFRRKIAEEVSQWKHASDLQNARSMEHMKRDYTLKINTLLNECNDLKTQLQEEKQRNNELEGNYVELVADKERRESLILSRPLHKYSLSATLKSKLSRAGFYTLGDVMRENPYDLIIDYRLSRQDAEELYALRAKLGIGT